MISPGFDQAGCTDVPDPLYCFRRNVSGGRRYEDPIYRGCTCSCSSGCNPSVQPDLSKCVKAGGQQYVYVDDGRDDHDHQTVIR